MKRDSSCSIFNIFMRIIDPDPFYISSTLIIVAGLIVLLYTKFFMSPPDIFHIVISGSKIESFLFAYQISRLGLTNLNITLLGKFDPGVMQFLDSGDLEYDNIHMPSLNSPYIDRRILHFCGDEPLLKQLLSDTHLQYKIKRSELLFNKGSNIMSSEEAFVDDTYRIDKEGVHMDTIYKYGLSHQTAKWIFTSFQAHLNWMEHVALQEQSMKGLLNRMMPLGQKTFPNGLEYLSQVIGLDQKYIRDYVNPVISSTYLHNVNSVAMLFKLLPLYCKNMDNSWGKKPANSGSGRKNNVLIFDERLLAAKILQKLQVSAALVKIEIQNMKLLQFQQVQNHKVYLKVGAGNSYNNLQGYQNTSFGERVIQADALFLLEDLEEENERQISYYRTIVDGLVHKDENQEEVYTIYFQNQQILSVTRLCANDCKQFRNSVYLVISKARILQKDLIMFTQHQIITSKKYWNPRPQLQSSGIKFRQTPHVYRIMDTELISDNYEMKLQVFRNLANLLKKQIQSNEHFEMRHWAKYSGSQSSSKQCLVERFTY